MKGVLQGNVPNDTATGGPNPIQTGATGLGGTVGNTVGNTANTGGNLASNVGQTVGNTASNLGQTARDFGQTGSLGGLGRDTTSTLGQAVGDTGTTSGNLAKNTFGTVGGTFSDTGSTIGAQTSGNLGQGLATGFERTGSGIGGVGNLAGGMTSAASNTMGNVMGAPSSLVGTGQTSNLQSNFPSGTGLPLGETYSSGYSSGFPTGQTGYSSGYSSGLPTGYSSGLPTGYSSVGYSTSGLTTGTFSQEIRSAPTILHEKLEKPTIVRETILPQEKIEVQPIIHREREQLEVHEVVQPMHERDIAPTSVKYATLPAQMKADVRESDANFQNQYRAATTRYVPDVETRGIQREFLNKAPILEEHVSKKIIEEVQPVLYRETIAPTLIEETQPIYEKIVETPTIFEETRQTVELGTKILGVSNVSTGISNLGLNEPSVLHKETIITKEIFGDPSQSSNVAPATRRII